MPWASFGRGYQRAEEIRTVDVELERLTRMTDVLLGEEIHVLSSG